MLKSLWIDLHTTPLKRNNKIPESHLGEVWAYKEPIIEMGRAERKFWAVDSSVLVTPQVEPNPHYNGYC